MRNILFSREMAIRFQPNSILIRACIKSLRWLKYNRAKGGRMLKLRPVTREVVEVSEASAL
jgi:hypothetical protein